MPLFYTVPISSIVLAAAISFTSSKASDAAGCEDFHKGQKVVVVEGYHEGADGVVLQVKKESGKCFYFVRGQRGVEMPFKTWYDAYSLSTDW